MLWESKNFKQLSLSMFVPNINFIIDTSITIIVIKVVANGSIFNIVYIFYRYTMEKLVKIEL